MDNTLEVANILTDAIIGGAAGAAKLKGKQISTRQELVKPAKKPNNLSALFESNTIKKKQPMDFISKEESINPLHRITSATVTKPMNK